MGIKTLDSAKFKEKMDGFKKSFINISEGIEIRNPWRPLTVRPHMREKEMDFYRQIPSQYSKVVDK